MSTIFKVILNDVARNGSQLFSNFEHPAVNVSALHQLLVEERVILGNHLMTDGYDAQSRKIITGRKQRVIGIENIRAIELATIDFVEASEVAS